MGEFLLTPKADCRAAEKGARRDHYAPLYATLFSADSSPDAVSVICEQTRNGIPPTL